jgi:hypothetical protein
VKEMAIVPGEDDQDTIHLRLSLPRLLSENEALKIISSLTEVKEVTTE